MTKKATSVEEWLALGNRIKTERPEDVEPIVVFLDDDTIFEFIPDETKLAAFICRKTGVYGYRRRGTGTGVLPHICREPKCTAFGLYFRAAHFWCKEHR